MTDREALAAAVLDACQNTSSMYSDGEPRDDREWSLDVADRLLAAGAHLGDEGLRQAPTLDELWAHVAASMEVAERHKMAIYRGEGVQPPDALAGIETHIAAGLAARVLLERARAALATPAEGEDRG